MLQFINNWVIQSIRKLLEWTYMDSEGLAYKFVLIHNTIFKLTLYLKMEYLLIICGVKGQ